MKKLFVLLALALVILIVPSQSAEADPLLMHAKFSPGGYSITLWMDEHNSKWGAWAPRLDVQYCDGSFGSHSWYRFIWPLGTEGSTFLADKPMERVSVPWAGGDENHGHYRVAFKRDCDDPAPPNSLFCNVVFIDQNLHRGESGEVQFISQRHIHKAWLQLGREHAMVRLLPLAHSPSTREWTGNFDAAEMLVGEYEGVFLVVQDEFDRQTKCRVGDLTVLDWE